MPGSCRGRPLHGHGQGCPWDEEECSSSSAWGRRVGFLQRARSNGFSPEKNKCAPVPHKQSAGSAANLMTPFQTALFRAVLATTQYSCLSVAPPAACMVNETNPQHHYEYVGNSPLTPPPIVLFQCFLWETRALSPQAHTMPQNYGLMSSNLSVDAKENRHSRGSVQKPLTRATHV